MLSLRLREDVFVDVDPRHLCVGIRDTIGLTELSTVWDCAVRACTVDVNGRRCAHACSR